MNEQPMDGGEEIRRKPSEDANGSILDGRGQPGGKHNEAPIDTRRRSDAQQEYFDRGKLLDPEHASVLSGWSERQWLLQPIARLHVAGGYVLLTRASALALMRRRATANGTAIPVGPDGQACAACGEQHGQLALTAGDGWWLCDDCRPPVVKTDSKSRLENTEQSRGPAVHDAPGSTIAGRAGSPPPAESQASGDAPESDAAAA